VLRDEWDTREANEDIQMFNPTYGSGLGRAEMSTPARGMWSLDMSRVAITVAIATSTFATAMHNTTFPSHFSRLELVWLALRCSNKSEADPDSEIFSSWAMGWYGDGVDQKGSMLDRLSWGWKQGLYMSLRRPGPMRFQIARLPNLDPPPRVTFL
jgi:hypothetical protein